MLFILTFTDNPEKLHVREQYLRAHIEWLDQHRNEVLVAGSLRTKPDATPEGACWIVDAADPISVEALFQSDPFWMHGLRASYEVLYWSKAFPDRKVPV